MTASYKMGPGQLILGTGGSANEITAQVTSCTVTPTENVSTEEAVPTLDGGELAAADTVTISYAIAGNLVQDLAAGGVVDWTWEHATEEISFVFVPNLVSARGVSGTLTVVPIAVGGDVKTRPRSDFSWRIKGTPIFGSFDPVEDEVTEDV